VRRALPGAFVLAAAAGAAALAPLLGGGGSEPQVPQLSGRAAVAEAAIEPRSHLFGDAVFAHVEVVVDRALVDPAALRLQADFEPYEPVGPVTVERRELGALTRLRFSVPLRCLGSNCVPPTARQVFTFAAGAIVADGRAVAQVQWPDVEVTSRVTQSGLVDSEAIVQVHWRANMTELPAVDWRVRPAVAVAALGGLAGAFAAAALVLLVAALRPARKQPPPLPPLERALALLEAARRDGDAEEQRRALDLVAAELERRGEAELAQDATTLAWSRPLPAPAETETLSERVARLVAHSRNGHGGGNAA
jgi:hypothetical protein